MMQTPAPPRPNVRGWTLFAMLGEDEVTPTSGAPASTRAQLRKRMVGGHFELGELIGHGGVSCVYACNNMAAAIKIVASADEDMRRRFVDEGRILTNLRHPHLVQVLAVGETDTKAPFMVLERLPGDNLDERLRREGPLPWREVVEMIAQVAGALGALHGAGVIHRDVKPSNIVMVSSATGLPFVKLIDLGIAKVDNWQRVAAGESPPRHQTAAGLVLGTEGFCPPEAPFATPNPGFDVFGLGATVYLLCTGKFPNLVDYEPMNAVRPACAAPSEVEALVADSLAVLPEERIGSIAEFQRRLETIRTHHVEDASPFLFDGCYELIESIGASVKAEIHRAYHRDRREYVALKILREQWCGDGEQRVRFAREAQVLSAVRHPVLPALIDCRTASTRKRPFIAMSIMRGRPARSLYYGGARLKPDEVIAVGKQLASALGELHAHGIIHRDVHGANVLIDAATMSVALLDCGMAELTPTYYAKVEQRYPTPPEARVTLGSGGLEQYDWTAPEARSGKGWTAKSDVFSLGVLLYQLATGKAPRRDGENRWTSPRVHVPDLPLALATALENTLADDPAARVDMQGLLAKLEDAAAQLAEDELADEDGASATPEPIAGTAGSPSAAPTLTPMRRDPPPLAQALVVTAVAVLLVSLAVVIRGQAQNETTTSEPPAPTASLIGSDTRTSELPTPAPPVIVAAAPEPPSAAEPEANAPPPDPDMRERPAALNPPAPRKPPARTWETRMRDAEANARRCLEAAGIKPRRVVVNLSPGKPAGFGNVSSDSPHAQCIRDALERLNLRPEMHRRHTFFEAL